MPVSNHTGGKSFDVNCLAVCDATTGDEGEAARKVAGGMHSVITGDTEEFLHDYPYHSPNEKHWY